MDMIARLEDKLEKFKKIEEEYHENAQKLNSLYESGYIDLDANPTK
jgi:hypothetical protein